MSVICGDSLHVLPTLDAESVDAIVCDPPYGLSFMGKDWALIGPNCGFSPIPAQWHFPVTACAKESYEHNSCRCTNCHCGRSAIPTPIGLGPENHRAAFVAPTV